MTNENNKKTAKKNDANKTGTHNLRRIITSSALRANNMVSYSALFGGTYFR